MGEGRGISLDFKLVTSALSGVFIQRAFPHVDDARTKTTRVEDRSCARRER